MKSTVVAFLKKVAPYGAWGNGRFPQLNSRSATVQKREQGYRFFIFTLDYSDWF